MPEKWYYLELNAVQAKWFQLTCFKSEEEIDIDNQKWCYKKQLDQTNQQQKYFSPMVLTVNLYQITDQKTYERYIAVTEP